MDCSSKHSSIAAVTSVVPRFILLRTTPARWASNSNKNKYLIMYKDGRFAHLQRRRSTTESTGDGERLQRHLKRKKQIWSAGANAIGRARRIHAVEISYVFVPNLPNCTRTQFHMIDLVPSRTRSQAGLAQHVRTYVQQIQ